ncbi:sulfatase-like hydrolase/transferase [Halomarina salina]|uniref:Sulfatase-like hydrolase/transferase n=1 Tax=Halomarina salina TaxID=1872699 RepID=A0ABD5RP55_9EURY|nr:sulfatase-like hydrolase/transferase [Halomarina salina]
MASEHSSPNVLLVVLDSVRASSTSLHDPELTTTPTLASLAESATVFEQARAPASWSLPSHTSMFTGVPAHEHGVNAVKDSLEPGNTVFEELSEAGYQTGVFSNLPWLVKTDNGLKSAFDHVGGKDNVLFPSAMDPNTFVLEHGTGQFSDYLEACLRSGRPVRSLLNGVALKANSDFGILPGLSNDHPTDQPVIDRFDAWQSSVDDAPWAACINLLDAHTPFAPVERTEATDEDVELATDIGDYVWDFYSERLPWSQLEQMERLYRDSIRQVDALVDNLAHLLKRRGELENTLLIITGDHGEAFGEESEVVPDCPVASHGRFTHEELLHVPLLVKAPGQRVGRRESSLTSLDAIPDAVHAAREGTSVDEALTSGRIETAFVRWSDRQFADVDDLDTELLGELETPAHVVYIDEVPASVVVEAEGRTPIGEC